MIKRTCSFLRAAAAKARGLVAVVVDGFNVLFEATLRRDAALGLLWSVGLAGPAALGPVDCCRVEVTLAVDGLI